MAAVKEEKRSSIFGEFGSGDHEILVTIVKECQRHNAEGVKGQWPQFLASQIGKSSVATDPAKHSWTVLAEFINSLTNEKDVELVESMRKWQAWKLEKDQLDESDPWARTPEQELVLRTKQHVNFKSFYNFPSYRKDWVYTKRGKSKRATQPERLLGLDCEMCVSLGQVKEVVRVTVVDRDGEVVLNSLVAPSLPVLDYKAAITGVGPEELRDVTFTQTDAQESIKKLLTPGTILVGHGLHHDLRALKVDHGRVIDTALLFEYDGCPNVIPSLGDLCKILLKRGFRVASAVHDSAEDALVPLHLVYHEMEKGPTPPLPTPDRQVDKTELAKLFIHRISPGISPDDLAALFPTQYPVQVQMFGWKSSKSGTTFAIFKNPEHANMAFKALRGVQGKDSLGRPQKTVKVTSKQGNVVEVNVRKMGCHNGQLFGVHTRKGAVYTIGKEAKTADGKKSAAVDTTGEDFIEGVNGSSQKNRKERRQKERSKEPQAREASMGNDAGESSEKVESVQVKELMREAKLSTEDASPGVKRPKKETLENGSDNLIRNGIHKAKKRRKESVGGKGEDGPSKSPTGAETAQNDRWRKKGRTSLNSVKQEDADVGVEGMRAEGVPEVERRGDQWGASGEGLAQEDREERLGDRPQSRTPKSPQMMTRNADKQPHSTGRKDQGVGNGGDGQGRSIIDVAASLIEVEVLKKRLEERDAEVAALQRIVTTLARRQTS